MQTSHWKENVWIFYTQAFADLFSWSSCIFSPIRNTVSSPLCHARWRCINTTLVPWLRLLCCSRAGCYLSCSVKDRKENKVWRRMTGRREKIANQANPLKQFVWSNFTPMTGGSTLTLLCFISFLSHVISCHAGFSFSFSCGDGDFNDKKDSAPYCM